MKETDDAMTIQDLMDIQNRLQEKYRGIWEGDSPETAKHHLLYTMEEIGKVSSILKKRTPQALVEDNQLRALHRGNGRRIHVPDRRSAVLACDR